MLEADFIFKYEDAKTQRGAQGPLATHHGS
jgi:hypothetical protein